MAEQAFEKLGVFYLGRVRDVDRNVTTPEYLLYDSRDLTTHALCVGMTGSGKTGLCIALLEEAAIDGIPALVVDPKGDIGNLLLTFPQLRPEDFQPWVDEAEAARQGLTVEQYAQQVATQWRQGLAEWDQDGARIERFRSATDLTIYTPGSSAGTGVTILKSFAAPPPALVADDDLLRERVSAATAGLLALLGIDADPVRSREFILISHLLDRAWRAQQDVDLPQLIAQIQTPPMTTIGVMEVDTFYPPKDRLALSMTLNSLLASPAFAAWLTGEPLDIQRLLYTADGKPRISILSIAHLSDAERMFFLTILLNELLAWMRGQPGTSSLRAVFYMDEVFGFFPPVSNPPSKQPMLTLLKQARAFGLGLVLATQNPVDLDYKGLANCGTWFLGRLQTERDKARVLDGLQGAAAQAGSGFDRPTIDRILSGLGGRTFLLNNVHDKAPVVFQTRWVLSYLRGPLTRDQIRQLSAERAAKEGAAAGPETVAAPPPAAPAPVAPPSAAPAAAPSATGTTGTAAPDVPADIPQAYVQAGHPVPAGSRLLYRPALLGQGRLHFIRAGYQVDHWETRQLVCLVDQDPDEGCWERAQPLSTAWTVRDTAEPGATWDLQAPSLVDPRQYARWQQQLKDALYRTQQLEVLQCAALKEFSRPGETEGAFRLRLEQRLREQRDAAVGKLRSRFAGKLDTLEERIRRADRTIAQHQSDMHGQSVDTAISVGKSIFGALFGRKILSRKNVEGVSSTMRRAGRVARERQDLARARESREQLLRQRAELDQEISAEVARIEADSDARRLQIESLQLGPRKADLSVEPIVLLWVPWLVDGTGAARPAYS